MPSRSRPFARAVYRLRWPLCIGMLVLVVALMARGWQHTAAFSAAVDSFKDFPPAAGESEPKVFDARFDIWFDPDDAGLRVFKDVEDRFIAEDFVLVAFEDRNAPFGVFSREALSAVARLTARIEKIPYVRQVRSLTANPWIRWGTAGQNVETGAPEEGLLISDLFENAPPTYSDHEILERMIAVLGAERASRLVGEATVRGIVGQKTDFQDFIGEPRLLGSVVSEDGRTTALQVQILRPRLEPEALEDRFGDDETGKRTAPSMFTNESQWSALEGIELALAVEHGHYLPTEDLPRLESWIESLPSGDERYRLERDLADPTRAFMVDANGKKVRKFYKYEKQDDGSLVDLNGGTPVPAPADFKPQALSDYEFHLAGMPRFERNFMVVGMEDMKIVGFMFLMIAFVLVLLFRSVVGLSLPLLIVFSSVIGMIGSIWVMGDLLNNLTAIAPNMVTAIGIADAIHLIAAYFALRSGYSNRRDLIVEVVGRNALPVFLTSVTTAVGFFSLTVSDIVPMRMLGYTGGIGTLFAFALSMAVIPALLSLIPIHGEREKPALKQASGTHVIRSRAAWSDHLVTFVLRFRTPLVAVAAVLIVLSVAGLARVRVDTDFRAMFPETNEVMMDFHWIEHRLGGAGDLELVFFGAPFDDAEASRDTRNQRLEELRSKKLLSRDQVDPGSPLSEGEQEELTRLEESERDFQRRRIAVSVDFLAQVERFEQRLKGEMKDDESPLRVLTKLDSALDVLRKISQVQHENKAQYYRVPKAIDIPSDARIARVEFDEITEESSYVPAQSAASLAAQYYLQYENGAKPAENLSTLITADRRGFRMQARLRQASSALQQEAFARVRQIAREEFPQLAGTPDEVASGGALSTMTLTGKLFLFAGMSQRFTYSFIESMSVALVVITTLIGLIFRSVGLALLSLVPNVLPLVLPLGVLGLLGVALDGPAVLVVSVALGICVDDTIHFFTKYTRARSRGESMEDALRSAFREVGAALTYTTVLLILGFAVLASSQFTPNKMMGKLALVMIALAWVADFVLTPALLSFFSRDDVTTQNENNENNASTSSPSTSGVTP